MRIIGFFVFISAVFIPFVSNAGHGDVLIEKVRGLLPNTAVDEVKESPVSGLYQVRSANQLFYYSDSDELFLFGEIYNKKGESLTQKEKNNYDLTFLRESRDLAFFVGSEKASNIIYEFTAPDCPYCQKYEAFIEKTPNVKRYVFFVDRGVENSKERFGHVFCSEKKKQAIKQVFNRNFTKFDVCEGVDEAFAQHQRIAGKLGVNGTPTLFVNNGRVGGFSDSAINKLLIKD